jgi:dihydropyrimidinase
VIARTPTQGARLVVAGGTVVTGSWHARADVLVEGEQVVAVGKVDRVGANVLDATGCLVLPGGVDPHTHVFGAIEADTRSALLGGTTTVLAYVDAAPGETPAEAAQRTLEDEVPLAATDVGFHAVIWEPESYSSGDLAAAAELGVTSVKLWLAYRELGIMADDAQAFRVMREAASLGVLVQAHCENGAVLDALREEHLERGTIELSHHPASRPIELESEAAHRFLVMAALAGADAYVVHISGAAPLDEVAAARARGQKVYAEICTHHLAFTEERYHGSDAVRFMMTPPLRTEADRNELWKRLADGTVDVLASDHGHVSLAEKLAVGEDFTRVEYGIPGLEVRLALAYTLGVEPDLLSLERLVAAVAETPARIFGLFPEKGTIAPGADADVVIWDPGVRWTIGVETLHDGVDYTPYEGIEARGRPRFVIARGEVAVEEGRYLGREHEARFLARVSRRAPAHLRQP